MRAPAPENFRLTATTPPAYRKPPRRHCDDRCIYARGPICECKCLGENHSIGNTPEGQFELFEENTP